MQFSHAPSDRDLAERFWPDRLEGTYAFRSLLESGAVVDLVGTRWVLEELDGSTLVDTFPTIAFGGDGSVTGSAGCNTFSGTYAVDGTSLGVGPLGTTKMACADPTMFVESAFLAALRGATGWSVRPDGRLVLDGRHPLTFGPA